MPSSPGNTSTGSFRETRSSWKRPGRSLTCTRGIGQGKPLENTDCIVSADEKTSIQARIRIHASLEPGPGRPARIESEYERGGALQYLAAWDVRRGYVMGRCEPTTGIEPFGRLVAQVLAQEPYRSARRLFWIVDNGSSHRGEAARNRLSESRSSHRPGAYAGPRQLAQPSGDLLLDHPTQSADAERLPQPRCRSGAAGALRELSNQSPKPFAWKFNRDQLAALLVRIAAREKLLGGHASTHQTIAA